MDFILRCLMYVLTVLIFGIIPTYLISLILCQLHRKCIAYQTSDIPSVRWATESKFFASTDINMGIDVYMIIIFIILGIFTLVARAPMLTPILIAPLIIACIDLKKTYKKQYTLLFTEQTLYVYDYFCGSAPKQYDLSSLFWKKEEIVISKFRGTEDKQIVIAFYQQNTRVAYYCCKDCKNSKEIERYIKNNISSTHL